MVIQVRLIKVDRDGRRGCVWGYPMMMGLTTYYYFSVGSWHLGGIFPTPFPSNVENDPWQMRASSTSQLKEASNDAELYERDGAFLRG